MARIDHQWIYTDLWQVKSGQFYLEGVADTAALILPLLTSVCGAEVALYSIKKKKLNLIWWLQDNYKQIKWAH